MSMTEEEWQEFENTRGKQLLRDLAKGIIDSRGNTGIPSKADLRRHHEWIQREKEDEE